MKKYFILTILCMIALSTLAQFRPRPNFPSPQAAGFNEYGKIPMNLFTGQPDITIPLYEVKEGDISLPIALSYNLASVKPNRRTGWVGLGWTLNAGGCISRNVRGIYDEQQNADGKSKGFYDNHEKLKRVNSIEALSSHTKNLDSYELMTDEYNFSFGNYSGSFYMDENGEWIISSEDQIKVEFNPNSGFRTLQDLRPEINVPDVNNWDQFKKNNRFFDVFTLITSDGVRYTFGGKNATEYSISYYNRAYSQLIPTSWFLTKIESPAGFTINLEYEAGNPICEIQFAAFSSQSAIYQWRSGKTETSGNYNSDNRTGRNKLDGYLIFPVYLKTINSTFCRINLKSQNDNSGDETPEALSAWKKNEIEIDTYKRYDLFDIPRDPSKQFHLFLGLKNDAPLDAIYNKIVGRKLSGLTITSLKKNPDKEEMIVAARKTFYFYYVANSRRKLSKIKEQMGAYSTTSTKDLGKVYTFKYNDEETFPQYVYAATDHWGYYNKRGNSSSCRERELADHNLFMGDAFYESRNPSPYLSVAQAETIKEIVYPTGGKTVFEYRQHEYSKILPLSFSDPLIQKLGGAGGVCVSQIKTYDENENLVETKKYYYTDTFPSSDYYTTSGILNGKKEYSKRYIRRKNDDEDYILDLYSEGGFNTPLLNDHGYHITYSSVIEETLDKNNNSLGYTLYSFSNHEDSRDIPCQYTVESEKTLLIPYTSLSKHRGKLLREESFNSDNKKLKSITSSYEQRKDCKQIKIPSQQIICFYRNLDSNNILINELRGYISSMAYVDTDVRFKHRTSEQLYNPGTGKETLKVTMPYTQNRLGQVSSMIEDLSSANSSDKTYMTKYIYPIDLYLAFDNPVMKKMVEKNILSPVIAQTTSLGSDSLVENNYLIDAQYNHYKETKTGLFNPERIDVFESESAIQIKNLLMDAAREHILTVSNRIANMTNDFEILGNQTNVNIRIQMSKTSQFQGSCHIQIINKKTKSIAYSYLIAPYDNDDITNTVILDPGEYRAELTYDCRDESQNFYASCTISYKNKIISLEGHPLLHSAVYYKYDKRGNITEAKDAHTDMPTAYLWSYNYQYPIAEIAGATYQDVKTALNYSETQINTLAESIDPDINSINSSLREYFKDKPVMITTYFYTPSIGIQKFTDPRGVTSTYNYDDFGRLINITDDDGNLIEQYNYHYQNQ